MSKNLTMNEKESVLRKFVKEGWLNNAPGRKGHYTLGVRPPFQGTVTARFLAPESTLVLLQVRTFVELHQQLLDFDLPDETRRTWEDNL